MQQQAARLSAGDEVRVIAPSSSLAIIDPAVRAVALRRFEDLGLRVTFGRHVERCDQFRSAPIEARIADLHDAFADPSVKAILTAIGGYNANQLLPHIDWDLITENPKIVCGYSDITALTCSIWAKTGLVTYSGPHFSSFGMIEHFDQTLDWFCEMLLGSGRVAATPAAAWTDDPWFLQQHQRRIEPNDGHWLLRSGTGEGPLVGGNLCTLNLLHGTEYMPDLAGAVIFVEDDFEAPPSTFDRDLTSLSQQPGFDQIAGLLIGRFQREVDMTRSRLDAIVAKNRLIGEIPIVANVNFGHTDPILTVPVGGTAKVCADDHHVKIELRAR